MDLTEMPPGGILKQPEFFYGRYRIGIREDYVKKVSLAVVLFVMAAAMVSATSLIPKEIRVGESDSGKTIDVFVGQTLSINLGENPSTGYRWTVEDYKPALLEQLDTVIKPGQGVGVPGQKIFGFLAKKAGECALQLAYARAWEETVPPAKTFKATIKIRKAGSPKNVQMSDGGPKSGPVMKLGMTLGEIAEALAELKGSELEVTSVVEFRGPEPKEYVKLIVCKNKNAMPRCPNDKLPMSNKALKAMVGNLLAHYGKKAAAKEPGFLLGGFAQPGYVQMTILGTGLGLYFNVSTGEPMGKLTGKL